MLKVFLKITWEVVLVVVTLLILAMIGGSDDPAVKQSGYSVFMFYGFLSYSIKRGRWLYNKFKNTKKNTAILA